jgi:drug/metabolite transporter (DMT)-like permease
MLWLLFAFSGPVLWAISTHIDKYLVERYFKHTSVVVLLLFTSLCGLLSLPLIGYYQPDVVALPVRDMALISGSGILYMTAILFYLQALQADEASAVAPFFQAAPLFGYLLGYFVLGETLSGMQLLGGVFIVGGTLSLSIQPRSVSSPFKARLVILMLACALSMALSAAIFKLFAVRDDYWVTTFWAFAGQALVGVVLLAVPHYRTEFFALLRSNPGPVLAVNAVNEVVNLGGGLGTRYALLLAPLSLVQAVSSTTTLFVFTFGVLLSVFFPKLAREDLSLRNMVRKAVAAVLVATGVLLLVSNNH